MPIATPNFKVTIAAPSDQRYTALFAVLEQNIEIQVPDGFLTGGIVTTLPLQNIGPVLFQNQWYVWDTVSEAYVAQIGADDIGRFEAFAFSGIDTTKFIPCDGRTVSRSAPYDRLYAKIGIHYGNGDGTGLTFSIPDFRGRVMVGAGAGVVPGVSGGPPSSLTNRSVGDVFGEEAHALSAAEVPPIDGSGATKPAAAGSAEGHSTTSGAAHNNMQPSAVAVMCIRYA